MKRYYVVPAGSFFDSKYEDFGNRKMAEHEIARREAEGDDTDYGIYEVKLVAGIGKMEWGYQVHVRDDRKFIVGRDWAGPGYRAYCDDLGADDSPYGEGKTPEEAVSACADLIAETEEA